MRGAVPQVSSNVTLPTVVSVTEADPLGSTGPLQPSPAVPPLAVHGRTVDIQRTSKGTPY